MGVVNLWSRSSRGSLCTRAPLTICTLNHPNATRREQNKIANSDSHEKYSLFFTSSLHGLFADLSTLKN